MSERIALLLQHHFIEYCKREMGDGWQGYDVSYVEYDSLEELKQIFLRIKGEYDGFITSGALPLHVIRKVDVSPFAVTGYFGGYLENTYRILLEQLLKRASVDADRIGLDYLDGSMPLKEVLEKDQLPDLVTSFERELAGLSEEEFPQMEKKIVKKYQQQCADGGLDFVVTCFYSVVKALREEQIDCFYAYPSKKSLIETIGLCVKNIRLETIGRSMAAVIRISPDTSLRKTKNGSGQELEMLNLKSALLEYCKEDFIEPVLKDDFGDVELYLNTEQVQRLTGQYRYFNLPLWLKKHIQFQGLVSIGAGEDLNRARFRAIQARDYELRMGGSEVSIFIDEQETVHSLPVQENEKRGEIGVPAAYVERVANETHLSSETVYRVIAALQTEGGREVTAFDLVRTQGFSLRIATRVLTALMNGGYAERIGQKRIGNKGRPQNLYRLNLECRADYNYELK